MTRSLLTSWRRHPGSGAFRRFKDTLGSWPEQLDSWYAFSEGRQLGRAREFIARREQAKIVLVAEAVGAADAVAVPRVALVEAVGGAAAAQPRRRARDSRIMRSRSAA